MKSKAKKSLPVQATHLKADGYSSEMWKNGAGKTETIAKDTHEPWRWRLSKAMLQGSGNFSLFPGYDRVLVVLSLKGVEIQHEDENWKTIAPFTAHSFSGDWETQYKSVEPAVDFNVFILRKSGRAVVFPTPIQKKEETQFPMGGHEHFFFCVSGEIEVLDPNSDVHLTLNAGETLRLSRLQDKELLNFRTEGKSENARGVWVVIHHS